VVSCSSSAIAPSPVVADQSGACVHEANKIYTNCRHKKSSNVTCAGSLPPASQKADLLGGRTHGLARRLRRANCIAAYRRFVKSSFILPISARDFSIVCSVAAISAVSTRGASSRLGTPSRRCQVLKTRRRGLRNIRAMEPDHRLPAPQCQREESTSRSQYERQIAVTARSRNRSIALRQPTAALRPRHRGRATDARWAAYRSACSCSMARRFVSNSANTGTLAVAFKC
jgi:hypothetical protein